MADREVILAALRAANLVADERALVPVMACALLYDKVIEATNGVTTVAAPLAIGLRQRAVVSAPRLLDVVTRGDGTLKLTVSDAIATARSGPATARLRLFPADSFPRSSPDEVTVEAKVSVAVVDLATLCDGSTRPWAGGVLVRGGLAIATNGNSVMAATPFPDLGRDAIVPRAFFDILGAIGRTVVGIGLGENSITAHFGDSWWVRSALIAATWPDVSALLAFDIESLPKVSQELRAALASVAAVAGDRHVELTPSGPRMVADDDLAIAAASAVEGRFSGETLAFAARYADRLGRIDARRFAFATTEVHGTLTEVIAS